MDILDGEKWSADEVTGLNGFEPCGFDRIAADGVHPLDGRSMESRLFTLLA